MRFEYTCSFCKQTFVEQSAPNSDPPETKPGRDIKWTDNHGLKHSVARGASATDGGGEQRAYNHHILGTQHVFVCIIQFISLTSDGCNSR